MRKYSIALIAFLNLLIVAAVNALENYSVDATTNNQLRYYINLHKAGQLVKSFPLTKLAEVKEIDSARILTYRKVKNQHYVLIWYMYASHPEKRNGQCGAGYEEFVATLKLKNNLKINNFVTIHTASCWEGFRKDFSFNARHPEKGFKLVNSFY